MEHQQIATNGIQLHVVQDGPKDGPLVILLHGFPEFWYGWQHQLPYLAAAGYRVWVPDQRGYGLSDKPVGISAYTLDTLAADVVGLMDAAGQDQACLVGHDWGAAVAWWVAAKYPDRLKRMAVINVPHGAVMQRNLRHNRAQLLKSWYIFFFQLPWLPEALARLDNWKQVAGSLQHSSRPGTFTPADLEQYRQAWSQPGAYTSMLNWYRALVQKPSRPPAGSCIRVPTLLIWGARDMFLGRELAQPSIDLCDDGRLILVEGASHWVHHEEADRVNELIDAFLQGRMKRQPL
ncbi:MAG: alpha/beta hydrolase [Chloroflexi bacterium]|nr:alpha/beta hydrolase [Chloroflexota bacterium]